MWAANHGGSEPKNGAHRAAITGRSPYSGIPAGRQWRGID